MAGAARTPVVSAPCAAGVSSVVIAIVGWSFGWGSYLAAGPAPGPPHTSAGPGGGPAAVSVSADVAHHVLDARVLLQTVEGEVLTVAGVLEAAVRHLRDDRDVGVDQHAAEVEAARDPQGARVVLRPHAGSQAVLHRVGPGHGRVLVVEALDGDDRAEDLVGDHLVALAQVRHDRGGEEVAGTVDPGAAGEHLGVVGDTVEEAADAGQLVGVVQRAVVGVGLVRSGGLGLLGLLGEGGGQVVVDAGGGEHAGGGGAVLSGVEVPGRGDVLGGLLHVGVVEDDDGGLAAQ